MKVSALFEDLVVEDGCKESWEAVENVWKMVKSEGKVREFWNKKWVATLIFICVFVCLKTDGWVANSVDPDQMPCVPGLILVYTLFAQPCLSQYMYIVFLW